MTQKVHDRILELLASEKPAVRTIVLRAIAFAHQYPKLTKEGLAQKLRREVAKAWEEAQHEN